MNRTNKPTPVRLGPAFRVLLVCLFLGAPAIGLLQQKARLATLGTQQRALEVQLEGMIRDNKARSRTLDSLKTPVRLESAIRQLNLGLGPPAPNQIVRLGGQPTRQAPEPVTRGPETQIASTR